MIIYNYIIMILSTKFVIHIYIYIYIYIYIPTYTYVRTYTHKYIHTHTYLHAYIHTYIRTYIHTYIHTYLHTHTHTHTYSLKLCCGLFPVTHHSNSSLGRLIVEVSRAHTDTPHSGRLPQTSDQPFAEAATYTTQETNIHALSGI